MSKVTRKDGRESFKEFGEETRDKAAARKRLSRRERMQRDASGRLPNRNERRQPAPGAPARTNPNTDAGYKSEELVGDFNFLACAPFVPGEIIEACPVCKEDPNAFVPDYTLSSPGEVFFDGKNCLQCIVTVANSPSHSTDPVSAETLNSLDFQLETKEKMVRQLMEYYNKAEIATVWYYTLDSAATPDYAGNPSDGAVIMPEQAVLIATAEALGADVGSLVGAVLGASEADFEINESIGVYIPPLISGWNLRTEERDVVAELMKYAEFEYNIPIQNKARTRIKISVPVEIFDRSPANLISESEEEFETEYNVTFEAQDFLPMFRRTVRALKVYANQVDRWTTLDGGSFLEVESGMQVYLDLKAEAALLDQFKEVIKELIKSQGFSFTGIGSRIEKISFKFERNENDKIILREIRWNKFGCPTYPCEVILSEEEPEFRGLYKGIMKLAPMNESRTMYYVGSLPEMDISLQAIEPTPWLEFVTAYTYPKIAPSYATNDNTALSAAVLACKSAGEQEEIQEPGILQEALNDFINGAIDIGLSIPDLLLEMFAASTCYTREEYAEKLTKLNLSAFGGAIEDEIKAQLDRILAESKNIITTDDPTLQIVFDELMNQAQIEAGLHQTAAIGAVPPNVDPDIKKRKIKKEWRNYIRENEWGLWKRLNDRLAWCGWVSLLVKAIECVSTGLDDGDIQRSIVEAAINAMDNMHIERIFVGLPADKQLEIKNMVGEQFAGLPAPWEQGYVEGSYSGPGFSAIDAIAIIQAQAELEGQTEVIVDSYLEAIAQLSGVDVEDVRNQYSDASVEEISAAYDAAYQAALDAATAEPDPATTETPAEYNPVDFRLWDGTLSVGSTGDDVRALQELLSTVGFDPRGTDGIYGGDTETAVTNFQASMVSQGFDLGSAGASGNGVDGIAGQTTHSVLVVAYNMLLAEAEGLEYDPLAPEEPEEPEEIPEVYTDPETGEQYTKTATGDLVPVEDADVLATSVESVQAISALLEEVISGAGLEEVAAEAGATPGLEVSYTGGEFGFGEQSPGAGGTYGTALGNVQKAMFDAYRAAFLDAVGVDTLLDELNKLPGAQLVASIFQNFPCKPVPMWAFNPRLDSFLNTLEFSFGCGEACGLDGDLTLPSLKAAFALPEGNFNIFTLLLERLKEAFLQLALAMILKILQNLLSLVFNINCEAGATLGVNLLDLFEGSWSLRDTLQENLCPASTTDELYDALRDIFGAVGGPDSQCIQSLTNEDMGDFFDDLSLMLTQGQVLQLFSGTANNQTMALATEVAKTSDNECIRDLFSDPGAFGRLFPALGSFIPNLQELRDKLIPDFLNEPIHPCPPDVKGRIEDLKCSLLQAKGLSREECRKQLDALKEKGLTDLKDLLNLAQNGPFANLPAFASDPFAPADECTPPSFSPATDPVLQDFLASISSAIFQQIEEQHLQDLMRPVNPFTGHGGVINCIMSDTKGRPWKKHNWLVRTFGSPRAADLGFFEFASDDAIRQPGSVAGVDAEGDPAGRDNIPVNVYGVELKKEAGKGASFWGYSEGGFPPTVGAWMHKQLTELEPKFHTLVAPEGFASYSDAMDAYEQVQYQNELRVARRLKYVEAFLKQFGLDGEDIGTAAGDVTSLKLAAEMDGLFSPGEKPEKDPGFDKWSPQDLIRRVLIGDKVELGDVTVKANDNDPSKWTTFNKGYADTDGQTFTDRWSTGEQYALLELPDTSSADVRITYVDYGDGASDDPVYPQGTPLFEFDLQYDFNIFNEDGTLSKDNEYIIKIVETIRSPTGGGKLKRKEAKKIAKAGGEIPPPSVLEEGEFVFTSYEVKSKSTPDQEVTDFIETLELGDEVKDAYEIETFYRFFAQALVNASSDPQAVKLAVLQPEFRDYFAKGGLDAEGVPRDRVFDQISNGFLKRVSHFIATGMSSMNAGEATNASEAMEADNYNADIASKIAFSTFSSGFKFGWDPYEEPEIIYMDPETYGGALGKMFPAATPPPFYVQEQQYTGWMDIANALLPEVDGCEPARTHLFSLTDVSEAASQLGSQLVADPRLGMDPLCIREAPYDKLMTGNDAGNIDGAIRAIIRVYVLDVYLRAVPTFIQFGITKENYDDLLLAFVAERIKKGLFEDGKPRSQRTDELYYYRILEQVVNNTVRKIDSGLLDPETDFTADEQEALDIITAKVQWFYKEYDGQLEILSDAAITSQDWVRRVLSTPAASSTAGLGAGSASFSKKEAKAAKKNALLTTIAATEEQAAVFLRRYIKEEFAAIREDFGERLPASVNDVNYLFLLNDTWVRGSIYGGTTASEEPVVTGPYDVMSDPNNSDDYVIQSGMPESLATMQQLFSDQFGPEWDGIIDGMFAGISADMEDGTWPFVLEKYIRILDKSSPPAEVGKRSENLYNIVNINDWDNYVKELKSKGVSGLISNFWSGPMPLTGDTTEVEGHIHEFEIDENGNGWALEAVNPEAPEIRHAHRIIDGVIQEAQSNCYPDCDELYGVPGAAPHIHELPTPEAGWKFGLRLSYMPAKDKNGIFKDIIDTIDGETVMNEKAFKLNAGAEGVRYMIPIAHGELDIPDQEFTLFDLESYDVFCLIQELVNTIEYKMMFKYVFPIPRFISLMAVYCIHGFFASIGNSEWPTNGGDMWEVPGGRRGKGFRKWIRGEETFKRTRQAARGVFTSFYEAAQTLDFAATEDSYNYKNFPNSIRDLIRPKVNFEDGLRWWQRGRKLKRRPFDMNGEECDEG